MLPPVLQPDPTPLAMPRAEREDGAFVRTAALHREPKLAQARYYVRGPNTMLDGETVYVFACAPHNGLCQLLAVSIPDALVAARDGAGVREWFEQRDRAYACSGQAWLKPLGRASGPS